ncbi:MAG TPA: FAD-linked oxidase C-terminal domain-containing protein [Nocardioidaceae bacterium]|nr:FAD-linked oxidase C-terminal domain-containing protein [Nocardioidaceae bacterium]
MNTQVIAALRQALPPECLVTDADRMQAYRLDRAMFCAAGSPAVVVLARETAHVQTAVRVAAEHGVPVVPQGARSGLSGAANAIEGCIVLSVEKMDKVLEVDVANRVVVTQPGVFNAVLSRAVAERGLFYPPDPASWEFSSIGGNLATGAGGLCCVKYGVTSDYVLGLEVVLASGEVLRTGRRTVKGVAGYDLTKLFVGSEGTLGVITEATLMLRPAAETPLTVAAEFADTVAAARAISAIVSSGAVPSMLEFMDRTMVRAVDDAFHIGVSPDCGALVLAQCDTGARAADDLAQIAALLRKNGATDVAVADDAQESELLLAARRQVLTAMERLGTILVDDVCVPRDRLSDLVARVERISQHVGLVIGIVGHAGDGNFHPTVVFDPTETEEVQAAKQAFDAIMLAGLELGGTITGEHGVGVLKKQLLEREAGPVSMRVHRGIKQALDPQGILNPGKIFNA